MTEIIHKELSDIVIDTAIYVQRELGIGFLEKIYENSLKIALIEKQKKIEVSFHNQNVGDYFADLVVND
jgi:GxxExxY protein